MGCGLGCNNIQKHGEHAVCKTTYMTRGKGSERRPFIFSFRLNIVLHDSHQVDEIVVEIEEWKEVPGNYDPDFSRALLSLWRDQLYLKETVLHES